MTHPILKGGDEDDKNQKSRKEEPNGGPGAGNYNHDDILERAGKGEDTEEKNIS